MNASCKGAPPQWLLECSDPQTLPSAHGRHGADADWLFCVLRAWNLAEINYQINQDCVLWLCDELFITHTCKEAAA